MRILKLQCAVLPFVGLLLVACSNQMPTTPSIPREATSSSDQSARPVAPTASAPTLATAATPRALGSPLPSPGVTPVALTGRIAFASDESGVYQISVATFPGGLIKRLTSSPDPGDAEPEWSPDGAFIVFNSGRVASEGYGVYRMDADGSNQTKLASVPGRRSLNFAPKVSPDGKKILFHSNRDGNFEIYVANIDGSAPKNLTNDAGNDVTPSWSRAGDLVVWSANRTGDGYQLYVARPDGSGTRQITRQNASNTARPAFSPDGTKIAFSIQSFSGTPAKLAVVNTDGAEFRILDLGPGEFQMGSWTGETSLIYAWRLSDTDHYKIVTSRLDGTERQVLVSVGGNAAYPSWTR